MTRDAKTPQLATNLRLLVILEEVVRRGVAVKAADLITTTGLPKPTIHRLLQTLEEEGFLQRDLDGRSFEPGNRLRALAISTLSSDQMRTGRLAILQAVAEEIGETCNIAIPDREGMIYLDRIETTWPLRIQLPIGTQVPFHCTASGKMYLSSLRPAVLNGVIDAGPLERHTARTLIVTDTLREEITRIRAQGYATDDEEFMQDMVAIAVAIPDPAGRLLATLSVHAPVARCSLDDLVGKLGPLRQAAGKLAQLAAASTGRDERDKGSD